MKYTPHNFKTKGYIDDFNPQKPSFKTDRSRLFKDRFAQFGITAGGVMVLVALLLIFFYLLYVVQPVFESATVEKRTDIQLTQGKSYQGIGLEEQTEIAYLLGQQGSVDFTKSKVKTGKKLGQRLNLVKWLRLHRACLSLAFAYGLDNGQVQLVKPMFKVSFPGNQRAPPD